MTEKPQPTCDGEQITPATGKPRRWRLVSPLGLVVVAVFIAMIYGVEHILGWREYVSFVFASHTGRSIHTMMGMLYAIAYFGFVLVAPLLAIAAVIFAILLRLFAPRR